jgi:hypothetical protein
MVPRGRDTLPPRTGFRGAFHTKTSGETPIVRWSGERPVYAGRFNMEKRESPGEGRADLWADGLSAAREARRRSNVWRSVHQPQHRRVLPTKQAGGGAEAR